ncbi:hypothetical protein K2173_020094 [Erythroxylum novogranatense]|uniref:Uncharacterized protein n=1 Tax=Erythroxylum novogranatense TaxID=1862640 RepID=A0AAV8U736_9ROSI|nr:hypothetical protein K2173_020094 [Erythroxylum novogranatense]
MGRSCFLKLLLVLALLLLSISHGFGRKILIDTVDVGDSSVPEQEASAIDRKMIEVLDYQDPKPNTNPRTGFIYGPSPRG